MNNITTIKELKCDFLLDEILSLTIQSALSTRNIDYPVYNDISKEKMKNEFIKYLKNYLFNKIYLKRYNITEKNIYTLINDFSSETSSEYGKYLHLGKFRIGISQKLINLFLKYLWVLGLLDKTKEPPHCPLDKIILDKIDQKIINWTELDKISDYKKYIKQIKIEADKNNQSIAVWELNEWNKSKTIKK